jgi:hypothetical protein
MTIFLEKKSRQNTLIIAKKELESELTDSLVEILKNQNNDGKIINMFNIKNNSEGISTQETKSLIMGNLLSLPMKRRVGLIGKIALISGSATGANLLTDGALYNNISPYLGSEAITPFLLPVFLGVVYCAVRAKVMSNRKLTEESIAKTLLGYDNVGEEKEYEKSLKRVISEFVNSSLSKNLAVLNNLALGAEEYVNKVLSVSQKIIKQLPKCIFSKTCELFTNKKIFDYDFKDVFTSDYEEKSYKGSLYKSFYNYMGTQIEDIGRDSDSTDVNNKIKIIFNEVVEKTYKEILNINIVLIAQRKIDSILSSDSNTKEVSNDLKTLIEIQNLKNVYSNNPLNKYTLLSNIVEKFLKDFNNLDSKSYEKLKENKASFYSDTMEEELSKISVIFSESKAVKENKLNILFENTVIDKKPIFKEIWEENKVDRVIKEKALKISSDNIDQKRVNQLISSRSNNLNI